MRIVFDMDGTITEGQFLEPPRTQAMYAALGPYDNDTAAVWNDLNWQHELYIITARSDKTASGDIADWLASEGMSYPVSIITNPVEGRKNKENGVWKGELVKLLQPQLVFDDSPNVFMACIDLVPTFLMDNPHWPENQTIQTDTSNCRVKSWKEIGQIIEAHNNRELHKQQSGV